MNKTFLVLPMMIFIIIISFLQVSIAQKPSQLLIPLSIGNTWTNSRTIFDKNGNYQSNDKYSYYITGRTIINGEDWYKVVYDLVKSDTSYWNNFANGMNRWLTSTSKYMFYKYPVALGEKYTVSASNPPMDITIHLTLTPKSSKSMVLKEN